MPTPPPTVSPRKIPPGKALLDSLEFPTSTSPAEAVSSVAVLLVAASSGTRALFAQAFESSNWRLEAHGSASEAVRRLRESPMAVVIYEESTAPLPVSPSFDPDAREPWLDLLEQTRNLPYPPKVIVASRRADDRMWAEVLHQGGYDVLPLPLESDEVVRTVSLAWLEWRHERETAPVCTMAATAGT